MRTIIIIFLISGFVPDSIAQDLFNLGHYQLCTNCPGNPSDPNKTYTYGTKTAMKVNEIGDNYDRRNPGKGSLWQFVLLKPVPKNSSLKINKL
ncbi:MAG TPA: hypothetical protein PKU98_09870 [Saprospiraceae bacterium]|nr:hypothetical protein [Saprospiraceae bacterium]